MPVAHSIVRVEAESSVQVAGGGEIVRKRLASMACEGCDHSHGNPRGDHGEVVIARRIGGPSRRQQDTSASKRSVALHLQRAIYVVAQAACAQARHLVAVNVVSPELPQL